MKVLVRKHKPNAVLAQLRGHIYDSKRREGLKFIGVDVDWPPFAFAQRGACESGERQRSNDQAARKCSTVSADLSLGEIDDENFSLVHELAEAQRPHRFDEKTMKPS